MWRHVSVSPCDYITAVGSGINEEDNASSIILRLDIKTDTVCHWQRTTGLFFISSVTLVDEETDNFF